MTRSSAPLHRVPDREDPSSEGASVGEDQYCSSHDDTRITFLLANRVNLWSWLDAPGVLLSGGWNVCGISAGRLLPNFLPETPPKKWEDFCLFFFLLSWYIYQREM